MKTVPLSDLFDVQIGYRPRDDGDGEEMFAVSISDLDYERQHVDQFPVPGPGRLWLGDLGAVRSDARKMSYGLCHGCVLFLSRGHRRVAVPITERYVQPWPPTWDDTLVLYYFFILQPKADMISPEFFAWLVNDGPLQVSLDAMASGSHIPSVSKRNFVELEVPVPPRAVQDRIVSIYELAIREERLGQRLAELRRRQADAYCNQLLKQSST